MNPNLDIEIKSKASGEVIKLPFDVSDQVSKDDLLVELDPVDEQRKVRHAKISLASSQAKLMQSRLKLDIAEKKLIMEKKSVKSTLKAAQASADDAKAERIRELMKKNLASEEEQDTAETASTQAEVTLENALLHQDDLTATAREIEIHRQDVKLAGAQVETDEINLSLANQRLSDTNVFPPSTVWYQSEMSRQDRSSPLESATSAVAHSL